MELYERVRYLRKDILKQTQSEFAAALGTSRDAINNPETPRSKGAAAQINVREIRSK